jgi:hypothetical protein
MATRDLAVPEVQVQARLLRRRVPERLSEVELVVLAFVARERVPLEEDECNAAVRRALLVFAAGGDIHRDPTLADPAVLELARDLDTPERRATLQSALAEVDGSEPLMNDPDLAWRAYACGLLAEAIGEE